MRLTDFDYTLPESLIAQKPASKRDASRLMVLNKKEGTIEHSFFHSLEKHLPKKSLMVLNDTRVIPSRFAGIKPSGGKVEILFLKPAVGLTWEVMIKGSVKEGMQINVIDGIMSIMPIENLGAGKWVVDVESTENIYDIMTQEGKMPIPPYIRQQRKNTGCKAENSDNDTEDYQTIYAKNIGAIAAPTAGLHFTKDSFKKLKSAGIETTTLTLHVGVGTFAPIRTDNILKHEMESERFSIPSETAKKINQAKKEGYKIVAVGTTTTRALESATGPDGIVSEGDGETNLMIFPGYKPKIVDILITNFHLPKSTLMLLVSAFASKNQILDAYQEAVKEKYRFYSYGDAMIIK